MPLSWIRYDALTVIAARCASARAGVHPSLVVGGNGLGCTEAEQPQGAVDRHVAVLPDEHPDARPTRQPVTRNIPSRALEHAVARGGECRDAAHLRAGHEA